MLFLSEKYAWRLRKMKYERNALIKSTMNNLPLARQFALTAVKLQMFGGKTRHVWHPIRTCFFVSCSRLDATDGIPRFWVATPAAGQAKIGLKWMTNILQLAIKGNELTNQTKNYLVGDTWQLFSTKNWWAVAFLVSPRNLGHFPDRMELGMLVLEARENRRSRGTISHSSDWRTIRKTWTRTR